MYVCVYVGLIVCSCTVCMLLVRAKVPSCVCNSSAGPPLCCCSRLELGSPHYPLFARGPWARALAVRRRTTALSGECEGWETSLCVKQSGKCCRFLFTDELKISWLRENAEDICMWRRKSSKLPRSGFPAEVSLHSAEGNIETCLRQWLGCSLEGFNQAANQDREGDGPEYNYLFKPVGLIYYVCYGELQQAEGWDHLCFHSGVPGNNH